MKRHFRSGSVQINVTILYTEVHTRPQRGTIKADPAQNTRTFCAEPAFYINDVRIDLNADVEWSS